MLQPTGLAVLRALGLEPEVRALGQPLNHIAGRRHPGGQLVLDVRYADLKRPEPALGLHRAALFEVLYRAAREAGVGFETGFTAVDVEDGRLVADDGRRSGPFDLVADASGARSSIAGHRLGLSRQALAWGALWGTTPWPAGDAFDPSALQQVYRAADRMIGVLPVGRRPGETTPLATFFWSLQAADHDRWRAAGMDAWKAEVLGFWPECAPVLEALQAPEDLTLARYGHHTLALPVAPGLAAIGDAAHATSPQLGQGVNMGLLDAFALTEAVERIGERDTALWAYAAARRWHVRLYQALSLVFTPFYQADGHTLPWIRDHVLGRVARAPGAARLLAATVSGLLLDPRP